MRGERARGEAVRGGEMRKVRVLPRSIALGVIAAGVSAGIGACSPSPGDTGASAPPTGTSASAIIEGTDSTTAQDAVVLIVNNTEQYGCTGTLVAPNLVLTARHCVSETSDDPFSCDEHGNGTKGGDIGADVDPGTLLVAYGLTRPVRVAHLGGYGRRIFHDTATNLCNHDLALLLLDRSIPGATVAPLRLTPPAVGEQVTLVGWGITSTTTIPGTRQQRTVPVTHVGPDTIPSDNLDVPGNEFTIGEGTCSGDSGGPGLSASGSVVGVVSRGGNGMNASDASPSATCTGGDNFLSELSPFRSIILEAFQAAGQTPVYDVADGARTDAAVSPGAFGASCVGDGDCTSGVCSISSGFGICSQSCGATACPSGYRCAEGGSRSVCVTDGSSAASGSGSAPGAGGGTDDDGGCGMGSRASSEPSFAPGVAAMVFAGVLARRRKRG